MNSSNFPRPRDQASTEAWRSDSGFPRFVQTNKSVYEMAGFEVRKDDSSSGHPRSIRNHSRQASNAPSIAASMRSTAARGTPIPRTSSALSNRNPPNPVKEQEQPRSYLLSTHHRGPSHESHTIPESTAQIYSPKPPETPRLNPARIRAPSIVTTTEQASTPELPVVSEFPTTPLRIAPPQISNRVRKSTSPSSERSSNASSIYSAGYDPLFDLSPRYDRTKSLLPYQREQLEQDGDLASIAPPPLEHSISQHQHQQSHSSNVLLGNANLIGTAAAPQFNTNPNAGTPPTSKVPPHLVSRSGSLASTSSQASSGPRTPDDTSTPGVTPIIREEKGEEENYKNSIVPQVPQPEQEDRKRRKSKKGPCRGCGVPIVGKSVSSRDGSLSGRWHKDCFCCAGCGTRDFQKGNTHLHSAAAEFYIFADRPLCHECYHRENDSICRMCQRGIEGECLDDGISRYHLTCLRCAECMTLLDPRVGFISVVNGTFFCPAHAEAHAQSEHVRTNSGRTKTSVVEKRRTRMLMM